MLTSSFRKMRYSMVTILEIRSEIGQVQKNFIRMKTLRILLLFILFTQLGNKGVEMFIENPFQKWSYF